jgi:bacteriorhodopsin
LGNPGPPKRKFGEGRMIEWFFSLPLWVISLLILIALPIVGQILWTALGLLFALFVVVYSLIVGLFGGNKGR